MFKLNIVIIKVYKNTIFLLYYITILFSSVYFRHNSVICSFDTNSWTILSSIEQSIKSKIEAVGVPLKDWNINIYRGVLTGFNEAFIIDGMKRKELIEQDPKSDEIIRPILRGRDIKRYGYEFADLWLINTHNGVKEKNINPINVEDYPSIKKHLDKFYSALDKRQDKGYTPYNLRNCAYIDDFYKQKIVWKIIGSNINFFIDTEAFFFNNAANILTINSNSLEILIGFLNSKLFEWYFKKNIFIEVEGGGIQMFSTIMEKIPIPMIDNTQNGDKLEELVQKISKEKNNFNNIDIEINNLVYLVFDLSKEEIKFIESL